MSRYKILTVDELIDVLGTQIKNGSLNEKAKVWLSRDELGERFSPMIRIGNLVSMDVENKNKVILYPRD